MNTPSPNGHNGRAPDGKFTKGNPGGPGNPHATHVASLRSLLLTSVTNDDMAAIVGKLVAMAKSGDLAAIRELLDRVIGKPRQPTKSIAEELTDAEVDAAIEAEFERIAGCGEKPAPV